MVGLRPRTSETADTRSQFSQEHSTVVMGSPETCHSVVAAIFLATMACHIDVSTETIRGTVPRPLLDILVLLARHVRTARVAQVEYPADFIRRGLFSQITRDELANVFRERKLQLRGALPRPTIVLWG